jgi:hypothetical protein
MKSRKTQGENSIEQMQRAAEVTQTADNLKTSDKSLKVNALCGTPDILLYACEKIELERTSYNAAIEYTLRDTNGRIFLEYWNESNWPEIARSFPEFDLTTTGKCDKDGNLIKQIQPNYPALSIDNKKIKEIALANGFKLKEQSNGEKDLNPYVYQFARVILNISTN